MKKLKALLLVPFASCCLQTQTLPVTPHEAAAHAIRMMEKHGIHKHPKDGYYYSGYGAGLFTVEMFLDNIALFHAGDVTMGKNGFKIYLNLEQPNGFIPRHWDGPGNEAAGNTWAFYEREEHAQPFLFQMALFLTRAGGGDCSWISNEMYAKLKKYLNHWTTQWDRDHNGLSEWASAPHGAADNQFDRVGVWRSFHCEAADLNSFLYLEFLAAGKIAAAKGFRDDAAVFAGQAERKKKLIQQLLWDEQDGFFYDRDIRTGKFIKVKSVNDLYVLWAGIPDQRQAKRLLKEHILNPSEFWSPHPLPSYAMNEPNYTQHHVPPPLIDPYYALNEGHSNWRGGLWGHANYLVAHGLERYGFAEQARLLAAKTFEVAAPDPDLYEWYNAETGKPLGYHPLCAGAEVLMRFLPAELETGFDPAAIEDAAKPLENGKLRKALSIEGLRIRIPR
ncbi:MAG: hypothetical protein M1436_04540 [Acidobacteria bacterium]|nr:hypothetical protein [Acidobacteriota bacterium]